jgi:hypothetical protein
MTRVSSEQQEQKHLLYELGKEIRKRAFEVKKKHGSYWVMKFQSGILFYHDDYNSRVTAIYPNGIGFSYGIAFGTFESKSSIQNFLSTIELVKTEKLVETTEDEKKGVYRYA